MKRVIFVSAAVAAFFFTACSGRSPKNVEQKMEAETKKAEIVEKKSEPVKAEVADSIPAEKADEVIETKETEVQDSAQVK